MILIFSEESDISSDKVMEWLHHFKKKVVRINSNANLIDALKLSNCGEGIKIEFTDVNLEIDNIEAIWYRRGSLSFNSDIERKCKKSRNIRTQILKHIDSENDSLSVFIYFLFSEKRNFNHPHAYNTNKLHSLYIAKQLGLHVPDTLLTNNPKYLFSLMNAKRSIISKAIQNNIVLHYDGSFRTVGTSKVKETSDKFYYSLFQEQIDRFCELRIFYLNDSFYPMAIFVDEKIVDARQLNLQGKLARMVPFKLPQEILEKLKLFITKKGINCGSIDMIVSKENKYYFLEINPVGQFDYLEFFCNYPISKIIAENL